MKNFYPLTLLITVFFAFSSCQQELHFPEPEPTSEFTVVMDGIRYDLGVQKQVTYTGDSAHVEILAFSPEISVRLISKSDQHTNGVGEYFLFCCSNDVFERTTGTQFHYETDRAGLGKQKGFVKVVRWDEKVVEGTYSMIGKVGTDRNAPRKEFTGTFKLVL